MKLEHCICFNYVYQNSHSFQDNIFHMFYNLKHVCSDAKDRVTLIGHIKYDNRIKIIKTILNKDNYISKIEKFINKVKVNQELIIETDSHFEVTVIFHKDQLVNLEVYIDKYQDKFDEFVKINELLQDDPDAAEAYATEKFGENPFGDLL